MRTSAEPVQEILHSSGRVQKTCAALIGIALLHTSRMRSTPVQNLCRTKTLREGRAASEWRPPSLRVGLREKRPGFLSPQAETRSAWQDNGSASRSTSGEEVEVLWVAMTR
jgi:hypothetical protein